MMDDLKAKSVQNSALWAAYGDALGFISELTDEKGLKRRINSSRLTTAVPWKHRVGGRFGTEIELPAGCYSDDTQLRLATCRTIRGDGAFDVEAFAKIELPVWNSYALGGGVGTHLAATSLSHPDVTWFSNFFKMQRQTYLEGGGNGAAMRIQPHVWTAKEKSAPEIFITDVVRNAICTHGHPRGILGAVFHALCLARTFELREVPGPDLWKEAVQYFPRVIDLIKNDPELRSFWLPVWEQRLGEPIVRLIEQVQTECQQDLATMEKFACQKSEIAYKQMVESLDCMKSSSRGSGTKTAIIASALAWMYRADTPANAIEIAANQLFSDTDTIATMAGAILGVIAPDPPTNSLLDRDYIAREAERLYAVSTGKPQVSFSYPDLLQWEAPRNQLDAVGLMNDEMAVAGLGIAKPKGEEVKGLSTSDFFWQWLELDFGQSMLCKRRSIMSPLRAGNLPPKVKYSDGLPKIGTHLKKVEPSPSRIIKRGITEPAENKVGEAKTIDELTEALNSGLVLEEKDVGIYEKYGNLFRLTIRPTIDKLYVVPTTEVTNLPAVQRFGKDKSLSIVKEEGLAEHPVIMKVVKNIIRQLLCQKIEATPGLQLGGFKTKIIDKHITPLKVYGDKIVIVHPGCKFRVMHIGQEIYLCLDYTVIVRNYLRAHEVRGLLPGYTFNLDKGFYESDNGEWKPGRIEDVVGNEATVITEEGSIRVPSSKFLPDIPPTRLSKLLARKGIKTDFDREIKKFSLLTVDNPTIQRFQKIVDIAKDLKRAIFPLKVGRYEIDLDTEPARLMSPTFDVKTDLSEPFSIFDHEDETKRSQVILEGLTRHGSFDKPKKDIKIVILTTKEQSIPINMLIERISKGADRYVGMGKTFGSSIKIIETMKTDLIAQYLDKCKEFMRRPDFEDADLFFVFMPEEEGKASYNSAYYEVKKFLTANGIPSQMVDEETLRNPKFKDLNIALNIFAKAGYTPWVLDEELENVDLFIGLSYSAIKRGRLIDRMMAYVNVFDKYGRWKFYQGDVEAFSYEQRHKHYKEIVKASIDRYKAENPGQEIRKIHIHYTQKLKRADMEAIIVQVNSLLPECQVTFVYINTNLPVRLFDKATEDGSLERKSYVIIDKNQFFMSTTGANIFHQKGMGTPKILSVVVINLKEPESINIQTVAQHILSLTRLNWASTRNFCHEPITVKFAGDISYFMNVFMNDPSFHVSERIRNKPWFL
jgi:ADP-ribosylglycohydrolase